MDASHPVSAEHELSTAPVTFGIEEPAAPGAVDNSCSDLTGWEASITFLLEWSDDAAGVEDADADCQ